ncbi:hypothetical protein RFI_01255, partial [Reticulomyxa filosa]
MASELFFGQFSDEVDVTLSSLIPYLTWDCPLHDDSALACISRKIVEFVDFGYTLQFKLCNIELKTIETSKNGDKTCISNHTALACMTSQGVLYTLYGITPKLAVLLNLRTYVREYSNGYGNESEGQRKKEEDGTTEPNCGSSLSPMSPTSSLKLPSNVQVFTHKKMKPVSISKPEALVALMQKQRVVFFVANGERLSVFDRHTNKLEHIQNIPKAPIIDMWACSEYVM